jgi:oxygen-independent coproporphyrinogen III oxidase
MGDTTRTHEDMSAQVARGMSDRQVNKILHGFPSPRLWREKDAPILDLLERRNNADSGREMSLYVGTPYCIKTEPDRCGYCLFPVEVYTGNKDLEVYLDYLEREAAMYRGIVGNFQLTGVFFGGGTANLYRADQYPRLMDIVRSVFTIPEGTMVTMEGIPQLFTREKLLTMKESGITRISMGAQQLNDELNQLSGRKQTVEHTLQAIAWCHELGMPCNVDLIFGWPRQTVGRMLKDLELLVSTKLHHITHYELNVGGPTDFALNRRHELPSIEECREMYRASHELLRNAGYRQLTPYEWELADDSGPVFQECTRTFTTFDIVGWGYAAVSRVDHLNGEPAWAIRNHASLKDYFADIDAGRAPVELGYCYRNPRDYRLSRLFRLIQGLTVDLEGYENAYGVNLLEEHAPVWDALKEHGLITVGGSQLRLVGDGPYFIPMIQALLARPRFDEIVRASSTPTGGRNSLPLIQEL